ncbi:alpha/beta hydrolase [Deinococcus koreensis]|uniref:Esterase n=1 Tax=Deinococcus koreensis TaxID=2054903 RepID=A0A2K3UWF8_9DEIO|nr:alpha/beta hydrolase-fold protein [Deinococcus koreensis]PNY80865.1 esterase [Deinococcus koreensis]
MPHVRFVIPERPPHTPPGTLFLTGDHRGWSGDPAGWTFRLQGPGAVLDAELPDGALLGVKVRVLEPDGRVVEEGDRWGGRAPAHQAVIRGDTELTLELAGWQDERRGQGRPRRSAPPRETLTLPAPWGEQEVRLWWPQGAAPSGLPRLILHDGHNVFDEAPTFAGESWDAAGAASRLADQGHPCLIAALSVNEQRSRRYVPFAFDLNDFDPGADEYLDWILESLKPALFQRFGPLSPSRTALAGSSFGGLITLYAGLRDPGEYGTLGVFSPAIFPADFELLRWMESRSAQGTRVWLDMGDHEGDSLAGAAETVAITHDLAARLRPKVREVKLTIAPGHWHDEAAWRARFPDFLMWWLEGLGEAGLSPAPHPAD